MSDALPPAPPADEPGLTPPGPPSPSGPAAPVPYTRPRWVVPVVIVAAVVALGSLAAAVTLIVRGAGTYTANGVTLHYPKSWKQGPTRFAAQSGDAVWSEGFSPTGGVDAVTVTGYRLKADVSSVSPAALENELDGVVNDLARQLGGTVTASPTPVQVAGLQGYRSTLDLTIEGQPVTTELTMLFHGQDQFNIECQSTASHSQEINAGCDQVKSSFALSGSSPAP
jgi:hypothetical protein